MRDNAAHVRQWRLDNLEASKEIDRRYYLKNRKKILAKLASPENRHKRSERRRLRRNAYRQLLNSIVPEMCGLSELSPCQLDDDKVLMQDHDHSCSCNKRTGCQECFRGLLCHLHNRNILPIIEKLYPENVPELVKQYLTRRPLKGTNVFPYNF